MARKKSSGQKRAKKVQARKKKQEKKAKSDFPLDPLILPDRRLIERMMAEQLGLNQDLDDEEDEADRLFSEALEMMRPAQREKTLRACLRKNPRHIDALTELARMSQDPQSALALLNQAIEIGEEDLEDALDEYVGEFWLLFETRPYMRAKHDRATLYVENGELERAAEEMEDMLRLNTGDNQGVRWELMELYCRLDQLDKAENLLERFPEEGSPFLAVTALLVRFRKEGDSPALRAALKEQADRNPHIVPRLLDPNLIRHEKYPYYSSFTPEEADIYCQQFLPAWKAAPGAITWLRSAARELPEFEEFEEEPREFDIKTEIQKVRQKVKKLPRVKESWICYVGFTGKAPSEDWMLTVLDKATEELLYLGPGEDAFGADTVFWGLLNVMLDPEDAEPRRPAAIEFLDPELYDALHDRLERLQIACNVTDQKPASLEFIERTSLIEGEEVDLEAIREAPQSAEVWELDWRELNQWLPDPETGEPIQPWMLMVVNEDGIVLSQHMSLTAPDAKVMRDAIGQAIRSSQSPESPEPQRPQSILVPSAEHLLDLQPVTDAMGVNCRVAPCEGIDEVFTSLDEHIARIGGGPPAMVSIPDITPPILGEFYEASAEYYNSRVWTKTRPETVIELRCPELVPEPWFAVTMGQMGEELGLMLFDDQSKLDAVMATDINDREAGAAELHGLVLSLNERQLISPEDVEAAEQFGWPVPSPEAWPMGYFVTNASIQPLNTLEVQWLAVATRALTRQLQSKQPSQEFSIPWMESTIPVSAKRQ